MQLNTSSCNVTELEQVLVFKGPNQKVHHVLFVAKAKITSKRYLNMCYNDKKSVERNMTAAGLYSTYTVL